MQLTLKGFSRLVEDMAATLQSSASALLDVSVGSVVRAIFEANASVALWMQWLILQVLQTTRAATSNGSDLDTWMADFGLSRLPATPAVGIATFSRYTATTGATVPAGAIVKTADGSLSFAVAASPGISIWQPSQTAYAIPAGVTSADLPLVCLTAGSAGNVLAGTITMIASSLPGIDQVINSNALSGGNDAESDTSFRSRFQLYLGSLSRATRSAVTAAVQNLRQGLNVMIAENTSASGSFQAGSFLVIIDDGTGQPSAGLLSAAASAIDAVRPVGTTFSVAPPQVITLNVTLNIAVPSNSSTASVSQSVQSAIGQYIETLPIGAVASATRIAQAAYSADPTIENVTNIVLNGGVSDVRPPANGVVKPGQIQVLINAG